VTATPERSRTYSWIDPVTLAGATAQQAGLEFLAAMGSGALPSPPIMSTLGITGMEFEHGRVAFGLEPAEWHYNAIGTVHGGVLATLLDSATGCAVHSTLPAGTGYTSLDLSVRFLRPVLVGSGALRCTGEVLNAGRRTALAEARLTDPAGKLLAHATSTCLLIRP